MAREANDRHRRTMTVAEKPVEIEVQDFDSAASVFLLWAGNRSGIRSCLRPEPTLAVDEPARRGYLTDDVYLAVAWIAEGGEELLRALHAAGVDAVKTASGVDLATHRALLHATITTGSPI